MSLNCPVCRAANDAGPACRRCRADLSLCFAAERQRVAALAGARKAAAISRFEEAVRLIKAAVEIRPGTDARRLLAAVHLLSGDYAAAWTNYCRAASSA